MGRKRFSRTVRVASLALTIVTLAPFAGLVAEAHAPTFSNVVNFNQFIAAQTAWCWTHWQNVGPADRTWTVKESIGLNGGPDTQQHVYWDLQFWTNAGINNELGRWQGTMFQWEKWGISQANSLTAHTEGQITVTLCLTNADPNGQGYAITAQTIDW